MIEVINLVKEYGSFRAVNDISFSVKQGEIFGVLGVNGAGKTTTLRMLTGILQPTSGIIQMDGRRMDEDPLYIKSITGYIPDRPYLYPRLTGREFLEFCADLYNVPAEPAKERIKKLLSDYLLTDWGNELIDSYSHGMKQRLATCAALVHDPRVLIIDEPMVGLDPHGARMLKDAIRRYAEGGMTVLLSTHSLHVAEEVVDRLVIIHRGSVLQLGTLAEIKKHARTEDSRLEAVFLELTTEDEHNAQNAAAPQT